MLPFNLVKKDENTNIGEINIEGVIGESFWEEGVTKEGIKEDLQAVKDAKMSKLILNINSLGGDVNHALSIYDMLVDLDIPVIARLNGFVASSATIIAMAADQIEMSENSFFLIHKPMTLSMGNSNEMSGDLEFLQKLDESLLNIYAQRVPKKKCEELLNEQNGNGKWLTADEAKEFGFIDSITKREKKEKKEEAVLDSVDAKRFGLPEIIGIPTDVPEGKNFVEKIIDKIFGAKEEEVKEVEVPTEEVIEDTTEIVDDNTEVVEEIVENEETKEEPVLSMYEETELRITNLEKELITLKENYQIISDKFEGIVNEKTTLQAEKEQLTKTVTDMVTEKVTLEVRVKEMEDEPVSLPINLSPEGNSSVKVGETSLSKKERAWSQMTDARKYLGTK